ncbi:hypothetical protein F4779DRAFT_201443 [Xylariaceae sp. FL0662B]|nr:hypothetical protein F4779DRAFT_201443 [Xylariaceae sp. FL0662B]
MARLTQVPITPRRSASNPDSLTDLNRLLARLQQNLLHADAERETRLRTSEYERNKVGINLEYARTLLTKLEQDALAIKVHVRRQEMQTDLNRKREIFEQLAERLRELEDLSIDSDDDDSSEGEDLLGDIIETPSESLDSREADREGDHEADYDDRGEATRPAAEEEPDESTVLPPPRSPDPAVTASEPPPAHPTTSPAAPTTTAQMEPSPQQTAPSQTLRARTGAAQATANDTASSTALRTQLFGPASTTTSAAPATATAEAIMDHQRAEQDKLTESMVGMARALKESTHRFSSALQEDQDVLRAAGSGLERSGAGLDTVAGRLGSLRRLTEGQGWWGRVLLYAWIFGLAVFAVLLVFVLPKLRF